MLLREDGALSFRSRGGILVSWRIPCALEVSLNSGMIIADFAGLVNTFLRFSQIFFWAVAPLG